MACCFTFARTRFLAPNWLGDVSARTRGSISRGSPKLTGFWSPVKKQTKGGPFPFGLPSKTNKREPFSFWEPFPFGLPSKTSKRGSFSFWSPVKNQQKIVPSKEDKLGCYMMIWISSSIKAVGCPNLPFLARHRGGFTPKYKHHGPETAFRSGESQLSRKKIGEHRVFQKDAEKPSLR